MYSIVYYSPTGNTKYLAQYLKKCLSKVEVEVLPLEFTDPLSLKEGEQLILMFPIHGFNAPRRVKRFIKELPSDLYKGVSLIAVGCNHTWVNDAASLAIKKKLVKKGYQVYLDEIMAMPLTIVMKFPEDTKKNLIKESRIQIRDISKKIINLERTIRRVPMKSRIISFVGKVESPAARLFGLELHAKKTCISCAICWENCPMGYSEGSRMHERKV